MEEVDEEYGVEGDAENTAENGDEPTAPRSDRFASVEEEIEAGIVVTEDEIIAEAREAIGEMDLEADDGAWGVDLYCEVVMRLTAFFGSPDSADEAEE